MRYASVCSGIEGATLAWQSLGWESVFVSEIEPFPAAVLAHHYPDVPNRGDMTLYREWPDANFDVLVGGTPCQSFSVAGLRAGLADPRGNLALVFLGILDRFRPRWVVWENVPGVLSSWSDAEAGPDGCVWQSNDFDTFTCGLRELGYGVAWAILDAQYRGLAQRRERVFVVGCLGDESRAAAVLFDRTCLSGHPAPRRETGEAVTGTLASRPSGGGGLGTDFDCDGGLVAFGGNNTSGAIDTATSCLAKHTRQDFASETFVVGALCSNGKAAGSATSQDAENGHLIVAVPFTEQSSTLTGNGDAHSGFRNASEIARVGMSVRRLTLTECERLQGVPDGYTDIPIRGKPAADGNRYKALGNGFAVPVVRWIGERIQMVTDLAPLP